MIPTVSIRRQLTVNFKCYSQTWKAKMHKKNTHLGRQFLKIVEH